MKEVDARGLSCPEPLMLTAEALKSADGPVKVLVTEPPSEDKCGEIRQRSRQKDHICREGWIHRSGD